MTGQNMTAKTIAVKMSDGTVSDTLTVAKVSDGTNGTPVSIAFLTNENITFVANKDGQIAGITVTSNVVAYTRTNKVTPTVGTITGNPTGMTVSKGAASANEIPISIVITDLTTLGSASSNSGSLTIPITYPVTTNLILSWSKVNTGATGNTGAAAT